MFTRQTRTYLRAGLLAVAIAGIFSYTSPQLAASVFGGGTVQQGIQAAAGVGGIVGLSANQVIEKLIKAMLGIVTVLAVLTIVVAGMYLILSIGDEGQKDKAKKIIQYTVVGIIVILLAQVIIDFVYQMFSGNTDEAAAIIRDLVIQMLNLVVNIVTTIAVVMMVIAGFYLIFSNGDEGEKDKAKKVIIYTIVGLLIISFARVIVVFINHLFD